MNDDNHDDFEGDDLADGPFFDGKARMPNGSLLCLCGRDPMSDEVAGEIARAAALTVEFDLSLSGCLKEAAAAYDTIRSCLKYEPARKLRQTMHTARQLFDDWDLIEDEDPGFPEMDRKTLNWPNC